MYEKVRPYLTEDVFNDIQRNRVIEYTHVITQDFSMSIDHITYKDIKVTKDKASFDYVMVVLLKDQNGKVKHTIPVKGQMDIIQAKNNLKISRDYDPFIKMLPSDLLKE